MRRKLLSPTPHGMRSSPEGSSTTSTTRSLEVREEITVDAKSTPPSDVNSPAPFVSVANADDAPTKVQDDNSDGGDKVGSL
jgi:hypothetical protein